MFATRNVCYQNVQKRPKILDNVRKRSKTQQNVRKRPKRPKTSENFQVRDHPAPILHILCAAAAVAPAAAPPRPPHGCAQNMQNCRRVIPPLKIFGRFRTFQKFRTFWTFSNVFGRFRAFSSVFERFRTLDLGSEIY